jgi:cytochrome c556
MTLDSLSIRLQLGAVTVAMALLAGCGGHVAKHVQAVPANPTATTKVRTPLVRILIRDYRQLGADVRAMRAAAAPVNKETLKGTPALMRTTNRFIDDLDKSHLSLKSKNRMIDHAAGAVATTCGQCFQQLEAIRPIVQIAGH